VAQTDVLVSTAQAAAAHWSVARLLIVAVVQVPMVADYRNRAVVDVHQIAIRTEFVFLFLVGVTMYQCILLDGRRNEKEKELATNVTEVLLASVLMSVSETDSSSSCLNLETLRPRSKSDRINMKWHTRLQTKMGMHVL
jgi:hypothetical protein